MIVVFQQMKPKGSIKLKVNVLDTGFFFGFMGKLLNIYTEIHLLKVFKLISSDFM